MTCIYDLNQMCNLSVGKLLVAFLQDVV